MIYWIRTLLDRKKIFISLLCLLLITALLLLSGLVYIYRVNSQASKQKNEAFNRLSHLNQQVADQNNKFYIKALEDSFSNAQLTAISQKHLNYSIFINGTKLDNGATIINSKTPAISIWLIETYNKKDLELLPESILTYGTRMKLENEKALIHISTTKTNYKTEISNFDNEKKLSYNFENVNPGEIITLKISEDIAKKMQLTVNSFEIIYNGEKTE